jgi:hypothetical protein
VREKVLKLKKRVVFLIGVRREIKLPAQTGGA